MSTTSPSRSDATAGVASAIIASTEAATCSRWKAGSIVARAWSWYSSSIVSRPSPSSGIRSPKLDSRQWKFSGWETVT